jgi:hypothetical protein
VVPPDQGHPLWVADFEGEQEEEGLYAVKSAVDEVSFWG